MSAGASLDNVALEYAPLCLCKPQVYRSIQATYHIKISVNFHWPVNATINAATNVDAA